MKKTNVLIYVRGYIHAKPRAYIAKKTVTTVTRSRFSKKHGFKPFLTIKNVTVF